MDEKEIDLKIEKEMVDLFIISKSKGTNLVGVRKAHEKRSDGLFTFLFLEPI